MWPALANPGIYLEGGANQVRQSRVEGEARIEAAKRPKIKGDRGRSPRKNGGKVWLGGSVPLRRKFLKNKTWNHSFWCIFEANILNK